MRVVAVGITSDRFSTLPGVPFAGSDVRRFQAIASPKSHFLTDGQATRAAVTKAIRQVAQSRRDLPTLLLLIAQSPPDADDWIVQLADAAIPLRNLLTPLWESAHSQVIVALDLARAHSDAVMPEKSPVSLFLAQFPARPGRTILLADSGQGRSHISGELQAGIWAYHLAQAFSGESPRSRDDDGDLTVASLRAFLEDEVDQSLHEAFANHRDQTPLVLGATDDEQLAPPPPEKPPQPIAAGGGVELRWEYQVPVKQLAGFQKTIHTPPGDRLDSSREWVLRLAEPDLRKALEETVSRLREAFRYTRRQIRPAGPTRGGISILTPDFAIHATVEQSETPQIALFRWKLGEFRDLELLGDDRLAQAFPKGFTELFQPFQSPANLESLIDRLEESPVPAIQRIDYPTDLRYCDLKLNGSSGHIRITPAGLTIASDGPRSPAELAHGYAIVRAILG